jgi:predicted deacylase
LLFFCFSFAVAFANQAAAQEVAARASSDVTTDSWEVFSALGVEIAPGTKHKLTSMPMTDFVGMRMAVPVWIARGLRPGKTLAVTSGIHGDELNGVEISRRIFVATDPNKLSGMLVVLPVLNRHGFLTGSRYMSDRRDLNRAFPAIRRAVQPQSRRIQCSGR